MKTIYHPAKERGMANHGWLKSAHSFSFANYYDPNKMGFGKLRVLNDDQVAQGMGFGTHPHKNMEIISIPLSGSLEHKDSMNNTKVIETGEVQIMSAGTGVQHSEYNHSKNEEVKFLQIWIEPKEMNIAPRYDQKRFDFSTSNEWREVIQPLNGAGEGITINQDAWMHIGNFKESSTTLKLKSLSNGLYFFILEGEATVNEQKLQKRDAFGAWHTDEVEVKIEKEARILAIEVPMN